ncbi:MAG TPA: hypothetical protein VGH02_10325 [Rhizomicrobium sp.]|jgi:hypothetical protein
MSEFLSKNRIVVAAVAVVVVVLVAGGGYYLWPSKSSSPSGRPQVASIVEAGICKQVVARARAYGVLPPDAQKTGEKSVSDSDPSRVTCSAQANNATFTLIANVPCDNAKDDKCVMLQKVTTADGKALYDTQNI